MGEVFLGARLFNLFYLDATIIFSPCESGLSEGYYRRMLCKSEFARSPLVIRRERLKINLSTDGRIVYG